MDLHRVDLVDGVVGVFEDLVGLTQDNEGAAEWPVVMHLVKEVEEAVGGEMGHPQAKGFEGVGDEDELVFDGISGEGHVGGRMGVSGEVRMWMRCRRRIWIRRSLCSFLYLVRIS